MKKFFVAACCSLMFCGSLMAQEATITAPVAPGEDIAIAAQATPAPIAAAPVDGTILQGTFVAAPTPYAQPVYGAVAQGCSNCGGSVVSAPMMQATYTSAPMAAPQGCCGQVAAPMMMAAPMMAAPAAQPCCAPVAQPCCAPAPAPACCDPCAKPPRQGFLAKRKAKRASRKASSSCCCG